MTCSFFGMHTYGVTVMKHDTSSPVIKAISNVVLGRKRLSTESIGNLTLNLTNAVVGSRIRVEEQVSGATISDTTAASSSVAITVPVFPAGAAANDLRIKVRKASSGTTYKPYETLAVAAVGSQSIYVSQIPDE